MFILAGGDTNHGVAIMTIRVLNGQGVACGCEARGTEVPGPWDVDHAFKRYMSRSK